MVADFGKVSIDEGRMYSVSISEVIAERLEAFENLYVALRQPLHPAGQGLDQDWYSSTTPHHPEIVPATVWVLSSRVIVIDKVLSRYPDTW